jgi:hypothetical protein
MSEHMLWAFQNQRGKVDKPVDFLDLLATEDSPTSDDRGNEKILKALWKDSATNQMRKSVSDLADQFIDEYIRLHQKLGVSYSELAGLKYRYIEQIQGLATREPTGEPVSVKGPQEGEVRREKMSQAKTLVDLASEKGELFRTQIGEVYVRVDMGDHDRIMEIGGDEESDASKWIRRTYYEQTGNIVNAQNLKDAMATLKSFEHPKKEVFIRVAGGDDSICLDLANDKWEQVEITQTGWKVVSNRKSPFIFKRTKGMTALPYPVQGGSFEELRNILNIQQEEHAFILIVAWLLGTMHPTGPYPILILQGEQGTAKSMSARLLRDVIDPWGVPLRDLPPTMRDLAIAANANWILGFDNLSGLKTAMSDAFCRLATGGGFATRELWTNKQEALFSAKRPLILNGIADIASRQDLAERSLIVRLPPIPPSLRKAESRLYRDWEDAKPRILGCLCSAVSVALRNLKGVKMDDPGRMIDFSYWVTAAEPTLPWEKGRFEQEYKLNRQVLIESAIETDPVATAILTLMESTNEWTGKPSDLFGVLSSITPEAVRRSSDFPKAPNSLSRKLNEAAGFLRTKGIEIERNKKSGDRNIFIRKVDQVPVATETVLENPSA